MRTALLCNKWKLPLLEGEEGYFKDLKFQYLNRRCLCLEWLFQNAETGPTAVDYFGGVGILETVITNMVKPVEFDIYDIEEDCIRQLRNAFPNANVQYGDATKTMINSKHYDLALIDHPYLTPKRWPDWDTEFDGVFGMQPKLVEIAIAVRRLPLLMEVYGKILNHTITDIPSYVMGISKRLHSRYGYSIVRAASLFTSVYVLVAKEPIQIPEYRHVTETSGGFEWL
jgi:hypothetical protein